MTQKPTTDARQPSPLIRWAVIAAAAVPATLAAGTMLGGSPWTASAQVPGDSTTTTSTTTSTTTTTTTTTLAPADFVGIQPVRVLDTRGNGQTVGVPAAAKIGADKAIEVQIAGYKVGDQVLIPANATSVAINVTIDFDATSKSFLTVWPTGDPRPLASTNNAEPGFVSPVSALMKIGEGGKISVYNQAGAVNVIIDVTGYFVEDAATPAP